MFQASCHGCEESRGGGYAEGDRGFRPQPITGLPQKLDLKPRAPGSPVDPEALDHIARAQSEVLAQAQSVVRRQEALIEYVAALRGVSARSAKANGGSRVAEHVPNGAHTPDRKGIALSPGKLPTRSPLVQLAELADQELRQIQERGHANGVDESSYFAIGRSNHDGASHKPRVSPRADRARQTAMGISTGGAKKDERKAATRMSLGAKALLETMPPMDDDDDGHGLPDTDKLFESEPNAGSPYGETKQPLTEEEEDAQAANMAGRLEVLRAFRGWQRSLEMDPDITSREQALPPGMLHPQGNQRLGLDLMGLCFIAYDTVVTPMILAFPLFEEAPAMFSLTLFFWTIDMIAGFSTATYRSTGELCTDRPTVALKYAVTWFIVDALTIGPDWVEIFAKAFGGYDDANKDPKEGMGVFRLMRLLRILRMLKLKKIMRQFYDRFHSEFSHLIMEVLRLTILLLLVTHAIACLWFYVGYQNHLEGKMSWVERAMLLDPDNSERYTHAFHYFTSMHWALTNLVHGNMEAFPENTGERVFTVTVLITSLITFSGFISSMTAGVTRLRSITAEHDIKVSQLMTFFADHNVPSDAGMKIRRFVEFMWKESRQVTQESDVAMLQYLTPELHLELRRAMVQPYLLNYIIFRKMSRSSVALFKVVCCEACVPHVLAPKERVFRRNELSAGMYFLARGLFRYVSSHPGEAHKSIFIEGGDKEARRGADRTLKLAWLSELALFDEWNHVGTLIGQGFGAKVMMVSRPKFQACLEEFPTYATEVLAISAGLRRQVAQTFKAGSASGHPEDWIDEEMQARSRAAMSGPVVHKGKVALRSAASASRATSGF